MRNETTCIVQQIIHIMHSEGFKYEIQWKTDSFPCQNFSYLCALLHVKKDAHTITNPGNETTGIQTTYILVRLISQQKRGTIYFMVVLLRSVHSKFICTVKICNNVFIPVTLVFGSLS